MIRRDRESVGEGGREREGEIEGGVEERDRSDFLY